jgi:hypothetical protein
MPLLLDLGATTALLIALASRHARIDGLPPPLYDHEADIEIPWQSEGTTEQRGGCSRAFPESARSPVPGAAFAG